MNATNFDPTNEPASPSRGGPRRIAVVGAGPAGMAAAYELTARGVRVDVYEAAPVVGGLTRSFELWGQRVDLGPHIFGGYTDEAFEMWHRVVGGDYTMLRRDTRVLAGGRLYAYPLPMSEVLRGLGPTGAVAAGASLVAAKVARRRGGCSSEAVFVERFGRYLYQRYFRAYCTKLWGADPAEVDASFAEYLVGDITIAGTLRNALLGRRSRREIELRDEFPYAAGGSGAFCEGAARLIVERGGSVRCGAPIDQFVVSDGRVVGLRVDGQRHDYDWIVSSMPIGHLARSLGVLSAEIGERLSRLRFRSTILVYLHLAATDVLPYLWVFATDQVGAGRITNFSTWHGGGGDTSILCVEYWCDRGDRNWTMSDDELTELATANLAVVAQRRVDEVVTASHVVRIERSHPMHYRGYGDDLNAVRARLDRFDGISSIGRAGAFSYDSQADAIASGLHTAHDVLRQLSASADA